MWQPLPPHALPATLPSHVRVTLADSTAIDLYSPAVAANAVNGLRRKGVESSRVSIPMRNVRRIEARTVDDKTTYGLLTVVLVAASVVGFVAIVASSMCIMCGGASGLPRL